MKNYVRVHYLPKKSGGERVVYVPASFVRAESAQLRPKLRKQLINLRHTMSQLKKKISFGLVGQKGGPYRTILSLIDRIKPPIDYAIELDIKDFYPSITKDKVTKLVELIHKRTPELSEFADWLLAFVEEHEELLFVDEHLAQGFPLVPYIAEFFIELAEAPFVKLSKAVMVRYVDNYYGFGPKDQVLRRFNAIERMLNYFGFEYRYVEVPSEKIPILGAWLLTKLETPTWGVTQEKYSRAPGWVKGMERYSVLVK